MFLIFIIYISSTVYLDLLFRGEKKNDIFYMITIWDKYHT